jgi:probable rRNA maturation factor
MNNIVLNVDIADERWNKTLDNVHEIMENTKETVFMMMPNIIDLDILDTEKILSVNIRLSNDEEVHRLNKDFRGMDKPTNVLSFANIDFVDFEVDNSPFTDIELGDIIIAYETMVRETEELNISFDAHFYHLLVHGLLHLLGFDHVEDEDAEFMESTEVLILNKLGVDNPYLEEN